MSEGLAFFSVVDLSGDQAAPTLPLAQVTWPGIGLEHWRNFIQSFTGERAATPSGIVGMQDAREYFCAMFAYRTDLHVQGARTMSVQFFTAVDLANSRIFAQRLLAAAEAKARELGCSRIDIRLYKTQSSLTSQLRSLGLVDTAAVVSKAIEAPRVH